MEKINFTNIEDAIQGCYCTLITTPSWDEDEAYLVDYCNHKALRGYLIEENILELKDIVTITDEEVAGLLHDASLWGGTMTSKPQFDPRLAEVNPRAFIIRLY